MQKRLVGLTFQGISNMSREYTNKLLEMVEEGLLDKDTVIMACVKYMSEDDVKDMMEANEFILEDEDEDDLEEYPQEDIDAEEAHEASKYDED